MSSSSTLPAGYAHLQRSTSGTEAEGKAWAPIVGGTLRGQVSLLTLQQRSLEARLARALAAAAAAERRAAAQEEAAFAGGGGGAPAAAALAPELALAERRARAAEEALEASRCAGNDRETHLQAEVERLVLCAAQMDIVSTTRSHMGQEADSRAAESQWRCEQLEGELQAMAERARCAEDRVQIQELELARLRGDADALDAQHRRELKREAKTDASLLAARTTIQGLEGELSDRRRR